ncbi:MAG: hypothetical protein Q9174_004744 [Haloplaca sp. 1 TL-2023]
MKASDLYVALSLGSAAVASPLLSPILESRQVADIAKSILELIGESLDTDHNAWDYEAHSSMCKIYMRTEDGGNCHADVICSEGNERQYDDWSNCFIDGVNNFTDPDIGPFSITFTKKDDECQDGLCGPILALKYVGDYYPWDVDALSKEAQERSENAVDDGPSDNPDSKNLCEETNRYGTVFDPNIESNRCGVPKIGKNYGDGDIDSQGPTNDDGYAPGWCYVHVTQYQKKDPAANPDETEDANYHLDITIYDENEDIVGEVSKARAKAWEPVEVTGKLPFPLLVTAEDEDKDPVLFEYADQKWAYADVYHGCNFGAYDSGNRDGDCGFDCPTAPKAQNMAAAPQE